MFEKTTSPTQLYQPAHRVHPTRKSYDRGANKCTSCDYAKSEDKKITRVRFQDTKKIG